MKWDEETEILVIGFGGAGAIAAISAHDAGANVLIMESTEQGGGNTLISFGGFLCPTNVEEAITYISGLFDLSLSERDDSLIRTFAEESVKNVEWVKGLEEGVTVHSYGGAGFPAVSGAEAIKKYVVQRGEKGATAFAKNLFGLLTWAVEKKRRIPVLTRTPVKRLVTNFNGEVVGVVGESKGKELTFHAKRAVILATGGYEADPRMLQNHVKGVPIYSLGHPGNRGDGIRLAQKVGAGLWHMNCVSCYFGLKVPEFESAFAMMINQKAHIFVDKQGQRFVNEVEIEHHAGLLAVDYFDIHKLRYPRIPFYVIFDETARKKGRISRGVGFGSAGNKYNWSKDNSAEIERGWIKKGESLKSLAEKLDIDPAALEKTVSRWNQHVDSGADPDFGRNVVSKNAIARLQNKYLDDDSEGGIQDKGDFRIETEPFYAIEIYPCLINTQGGPRRNNKAQVLDAFGEPIPRLYSAGELGSMWGTIYQGGGNIAECMVFGRIAGKNAAQEKLLI